MILSNSYNKYFLVYVSLSSHLKLIQFVNEMIDNFRFYQISLSHTFHWNKKYVGFFIFPKEH